MSELRVVAEIRMDPKHVDGLMPFFKDLVAKSRGEQGNNFYDLVQDTDDKGHLIVMESWKSEAALAEHCEMPHFKELGAAMEKYNCQLTITKANMLFDR
jgi:quinol monooxygenase YgiN